MAKILTFRPDWEGPEIPNPELDPSKIMEMASCICAVKVTEYNSDLLSLHVHMLKALLRYKKKHFGKRRAVHGDWGHILSCICEAEDHIKEAQEWLLNRSQSILVVKSWY